MKDKPENPPAFPLPGFNDGMTLRDYFAAAALQGILAQPLDHGESWHNIMCAHTAYKMADAMLAARKEGE